MVKQNRKCLACSTKYTYCPTCSRADALKPSWYSEFCSEPCMEIWTTFTKYNMNMLTKDDTKAIVSGLALKPIESYAQCIQRDYAKVMAEEKKPKRCKRIEIKPIDEVMDVEPTVVESTIEPIVEESHEVVKKENE